MGTVIDFKSRNVEDTKQPGIRHKIWTIISVTATILGILGVTVFGLIEHFTEKDWQALAEEYNNNGLELYNSGEYEAAIEMYDNAIALEEKEIDNMDICYYNRGRAYYKLENYEKAIGDYTMAIEINPRGKYYSDRAVTYEKIGDIENAALDNARAVMSGGVIRRK